MFILPNIPRKRGESSWDYSKRLYDTAGFYTYKPKDFIKYNPKGKPQKQKRKKRK